MSYIRSLSNPEGLYIISNTRGQVEILTEPYLCLPRHVFHGLFKKFDGCGDVNYRGAWLKETNDFRWSFGYKGWNRALTLWKVTVEYLKQSVEWHERTEKKWRKKSTSTSS